MENLCKVLMPCLLSIMPFQVWGMDRSSNASAQTVLHNKQSEVNSASAMKRLGNEQLSNILSTSFEINAGLNDAWFYPETDGQGFFITVFPDLKLVSLAWFTYDTELPIDPESANLGDAGHRWLTALGPITGNQVVMDIDIASGGLFDTATEITHRSSGVGWHDFTNL